jgi:hypothetical protein
MIRTSPIQGGEISDDFALIYQDAIFPIREQVLPHHGETFAAAWHKLAPPARLAIPFKVSPVSLLVFAGYLNELSLASYALSPSNVFDVLILATYWEVSILERFCEALIEDRISDLAVPACEFLRSTSADTSRLENVLRRHFSGFATDPVLRTLPVNCLKRIIAFPGDSESPSLAPIFDLAVDVYREQGAIASILFGGLDLRRLSGAQLQTLISLPNFVWSFVADSLWNTTKSLLDDNADLRGRLVVVENAQQTKLGHLSERLTKLANEMDMRLVSTKQEIESHSDQKMDELNERLTKLTNEMDMQLVSTKQEIESHSGALNLLKAEVELIRTNAATNPNLDNLKSVIGRELDSVRTSCATKVEVELHVAEFNALKQTLETIWANSAKSGTEYAGWRTLKSYHGNFLSAQPNGSLQWNRGTAAPWEIFEFIPRGLNVYSLKGAHGTFVTVAPDCQVRVNSRSARRNEAITVEKVGLNKIALKSAHGKYLSAQPNGTIEGNRIHLAIWETIDIC